MIYSIISYNAADYNVMYNLVTRKINSYYKHKYRARTIIRVDIYGRSTATKDSSEK